MAEVLTAVHQKPLLKVLGTVLQKPPLKDLTAVFEEPPLKVFLKKKYLSLLLESILLCLASPLLLSDPFMCRVSGLGSLGPAI